jgi:DNA-binding IclR family transcriptional regulator
MQCVGAPVFKHHGLPIATIWLTGPYARLKASEFGSIGKNVRKYADRLSKSLGYGLITNLAI